MIYAILLVTVLIACIWKRHELPFIFLFLYKLFDKKNASFIGIYYDSEIHTLSSKIFYQPNYMSLPDIVVIQRHHEHYNLYFLFRLRKSRLDLIRVPVGHTLHFHEEKTPISHINEMHSPYEKHTPFRLKYGYVSLHKQERRGMMFVNVCKETGREWPIRKPDEITNEKRE